MLNRRHFNKLSLGALGIASCTPSNYLNSTNSSQESNKADLVIWGEQGFLPEENEQINLLTQLWQESTGYDVDLSTGQKYRTKS
jgi:hypothetical protein